jgi:protein ImuA
MNGIQTSSAETLPEDFRATALRDLRSNLRQVQRGWRQLAEEKTTVSTGVAALDGLLPEHGLTRGSLSEWIAAEDGSGAIELALRVAARAQSHGPVIVVDRQQQLYAPAMAATGVRLGATILVRPESQADELWAIEQALRCSGVGAVLCRVDQLKTQQFRRLQLAAEAGTAIGLLLRSNAACRQSSWADLRLLISPRPSPPDLFCRRVEVRCLYAKGRLADQTVELEICNETGAVRLAAGLPDSATAR